MEGNLGEMRLSAIGSSSGKFVGLGGYRYPLPLLRYGILWDPEVLRQLAQSLNSEVFSPGKWSLKKPATRSSIDFRVS